MKWRATERDAAFLAAICASPDDDAPRLVYADHLLERGEHRRGELIIAQCAVARLPRRSVAWRRAKTREEELRAGGRDVACSAAAVRVRRAPRARGAAARAPDAWRSRVGPCANARARGDRPPERLVQPDARAARPRRARRGRPDARLK
ncbi:MAG: TIGR02996 domain-containing protein [Labilithrix sp.]|nr:TIGR02996 domain-containing protein [Labilithrix sp.]MCW5817298.1 TIGR02996 domain-containing protein [Labilithrix sp.]